MATTKQVKLTVNFEVLGTDGTSVEAKKVIKDFSFYGAEAVQHFPVAIAANQTNVQINFGGVTQGKRVFVQTDQSVTLKPNQSGDTGFPMGPGTMTLAGDPGITALFVTTGVNATNVDVIIVGV